jgi:hypothetical protein
LEPTVLELLLHAFLDLVMPFCLSFLKVFILALEALLIFGEGTMHDSIEVLFDFLDIFLGSGKSLHEDIKLLVQSHDLNARVAGAVIIEHGFGFLGVPLVSVSVHPASLRHDTVHQAHFLLIVGRLRIKGRLPWYEGGLLPVGDKGTLGHHLRAHA